MCDTKNVAAIRRNYRITSDVKCTKLLFEIEEWQKIKHDKIENLKDKIDCNV